MIKIKDFFNSIKTSWIRRYVNGLDDHWADMLDENLNCDINSRDYLLKMGAEHPKIKKIIDVQLPSLSSFIASYQRTNRAFYGCKEAGDNRWLNGSIFYNQTILRRTGPNIKKTRSSKEMLKPAQFGLKDEYSSKIPIKELYNNGNFLKIK